MYMFLRYCHCSFPPLVSWSWNRTESDRSPQAPPFQPAPLRPAQPPIHPCCRFQSWGWQVEGLCCRNRTPPRCWGWESSWRSGDSSHARTVSERVGHKWLYRAVCIPYWQATVIFPASLCCSHTTACAHSHLCQCCTRSPAAWRRDNKQEERQCCSHSYFSF